MDKARIVKPGLGLLAILLVSIIWRVQAEQLPVAQAGQPLSQTLITATINPTAEASPGPTPTIAWSEAPVCENLPQDLSAWLLYAQEHLADPAIVAQLSSSLRQAEMFDPALQRIDFQDLLLRLSQPESAETSQIILRELTVLWLNIMSGRLNQATELEIPGQPEIKTVSDLIAQLDQALVDSDLPAALLETSQQLQAGQNISQDVCSRLVYRAGPVIRQSLWTASGYVEQEISIPDVPVGVTSFSPDYSKLIIETAASDTGGGPLYLFDTETGHLLNLNQRLGLRERLGPLGLTIGGWHPDNRHFLIHNKNDGEVIWADLTADTYQRLDLSQEADSSPIRHIALALDGGSLVFVVDDSNNEASIRRYDIENQTSTPLTTLTVKSNQLTAFRLSPTGDRAAYVIKKGQRQTGVSYALEVLNLTAYTRTLLIEGNLGPTDPIWSPDGQKIAFIRKTQDTPDVAGSDQGQPWQGNIWIASLDSGEVKQITFVDGAAYRPVWSADSRFLAFITHQGDIGLVAVDQPGQIWRLGTSLALPQLTSLSFIP